MRGEKTVEYPDICLHAYAGIVRIPCCPRLLLGLLDICFGHFLTNSVGNMNTSPMPDLAREKGTYATGSGKAVIPDHRITQRDVAKRANVHNCTVSLALRDHETIPFKTRRRIQQIASDLGYRSDLTNRALASYRGEQQQPEVANQIALILGDRFPGWDKDSSFPSLFLHDALIQARESGYCICPISQEADVDSIPRFDGDDKYAGIIVAGASIPREIRAEVVVEVTPELSSKASNHLLWYDQQANLAAVLQRLRSCGFQRPGIIRTRADANECASAISTDLRHRAGVIDMPELPLALGLPKHGMEPFPDRLLTALHDWLKSHRVDCVISDSNNTYDALNALGLLIPGDISFASLEHDTSRPHISGTLGIAKSLGSAAVREIDYLLMNPLARSNPRMRTAIIGRWVPGATALTAPLLNTATSC